MASKMKDELSCDKKFCFCEKKMTYMKKSGHSFRQSF